MMLSQELLRKIRDVEIRTSRLVTEILAGGYQSTFKGRGIEFEDTRPYVPGDDVRMIDWNITARTGEPHIKNFREERELTVMLLVDLSASGLFGSRQRTKNEVAAEVAALLAHTAMRKNDKVGAILFTEHVEAFIPPKKGRSHIWRVVREILAYQPKGRRTRIAEALTFLSQVMRRPAIVFLISDFIDRGFERELAIACKRNDVIAVAIQDPRERELPPAGMVLLEDAEKGGQMLIDSASPAFRHHFVLQKKMEHEERLRLFQTYGVDEIEVSTTGSTMDPILQFFRVKRARKRSR